MEAPDRRSPGARLTEIDLRVAHAGRASRWGRPALVDTLTISLDPLCVEGFATS